MAATLAAAALSQGVVFWLRAPRLTLWVTVLALAFGFLLVLQGYVTLRLRTLRIVVSAEEFGQTALSGSLRLHPRSALHRIVSVTLLYGGASVPAPQWLFLDHAGDRLLVLNPRVWEVDDLDALTALLAVRVEEWGRVRSIDLRTRLPGAVAWWQAHTLLIGVLVAVVLIAALAPLAR